MSAGPYFELEVVRLIEETHDTRSVVLGVPESLRKTFTYRAGQFLKFHIAMDPHPLVRCYSLASCPSTETEHKVTIKRVADGRVSNWFHDGLRVGDRLQVMKPAGHFCLMDRATKIFMFSGGSGITPVISLLKSALSLTDRPITLVYANRDADSVIFRDELDRLAQNNEARMKIVHRLDDRDGFLTVNAARRMISTASDADFYVCGPGPYMDVVEQALELESIPSEQIFVERFLSADLEALDRAPQHDPEIPGARVSVYLDGQEVEVIVEAGETLLAAAHRAGLDAPCACMEGYCGACMARLEEGEVEMRLNDGGIDTDQEREGWVLTCQSEIRSKTARVVYPDPD